MRIGSAWTRTRKDDGKTFISIVLDDEFKELCPCLKDCGLMMNYIDPENRKSEKAPGWALNLIKNKDVQNQSTAAAEQAIQQEVATTVADDEEIPY